MRILVTAGPTREPIDPVRYLSNRSSGRMGYALAQAALDRGHRVVLVSGPVAIDPPGEAKTIRIETAEEMYEVVSREIADQDCAIFCAAVSDYRVAEAAGEKIKKGGGEMSLTLVENPDILGSARESMQFEGILVGFAAETERLEEHAVEKLERKGCDLLVANDVGRRDIGFDRDENEVTLFFRGGETRALPRDEKILIAHDILDAVAEIHDAEAEKSLGGAAGGAIDQLSSLLSSSSDGSSTSGSSS